MSAPAAQLSGIEKRFGAVRACRGASLTIAAGEIHALVGENGAGKSTLMRILAGLTRPDAGRVEVGGQDVTGWSAAAAIAAGVGMVHQHFTLVPTLTVAENVILGRAPRRGWSIDMARARREVEASAARLGFAVDPGALAGDLSVGEAQRVEIVKVLHRGARLLVLDEPTAVLAPPEVEELWRVLRSHQRDGGAVVLITHKLDEVMEISGRVTVLRQGETVAQLETQAVTTAALARAMVGRDLDDVAIATPATQPGTVVLELRDLVVPGSRSAGGVSGVSLQLRAGEILGIAGVEGNGQSELIEAVAGLRRPSAGSVWLQGRDVTRAPVAERRRARLAHVPEDRQRRGLLLDASVAHNLILGSHEKFSRGPFLDAARIDAFARSLIARDDIRPADPDLPARALSGGNQQKVVVARETAGDPVVLLAAHPTRGVDVGAVQALHAVLREARAAGRAILLVSSELPEILALSDRVAVMYRGRMTAELPRSAASIAVLGPLLGGAREVA